MNVRLSYSTELKEVPSKIAEMLESPDKRMVNQSRKIDLIVDILHESQGKYASVAVEMLDELRKALAEIDQDLMECQTILEGYVQARNPQPAPQPTPQPASEPPPKKLKDIPRGRDAVRHVDPIDQAFADLEEASGELPDLENNNV